MTTQEVIEAVKCLDLGIEGEKDFIKFIQNCESDIYTGTDSEGNDITLSVQKDVGMRISTYQDNGWIQIVDYDLMRDADGDICVVASETYTK